MLRTFKRDSHCSVTQRRRGPFTPVNVVDDMEQMDVDQAPSTSDPSEIQWRFSQIKGNLESDDPPADGNIGVVLLSGEGSVQRVLLAWSL